MSINYNKIKDLVILLYKYVYEHDKTLLANYGYEKFDLIFVRLSQYNNLSSIH